MVIRSILQAVQRAIRPGPAPPSSADAAQLPVTGRVPLDEPLSYVHSAFSHDRRRAVAVGERTGRLWLLQIDPAAHTVDARPLPLAVPRNPDGEGWMVSQMSGCHTLDRLLLWSDAPRVYAIPSCGLVAELTSVPGRATCLSPAGLVAISVNQGEGWVMELDFPPHAWRETRELHRIERKSDGEEEDLYLDHVDGIVANPCAATRPDEDGGEAFWLAAGCYGFVVIHRVETAWGAYARRLDNQSHSFGEMVYDPTELLRPWGHRHAFVVHGSGTGLAALDPETGELHHCWIRGRRQQPYAFIGAVVACGDAPLAWGQSKDGAFLWRVGQPPVMMPDPPGTVLALYPGALLCLAPEGDALLWCATDAAGTTDTTGTTG